jgi:HlyD family secretion protein
MPANPADLSGLRRAPTLRSGTSSLDQSGYALPVPRPSSRWRTRLLVPLIILLATGGVLAYSSRDLLRPAIKVMVAPVIPKPLAMTAQPADQPAATLDSGDSASKPPSGSVAVQAPGWVEPDPYAFNVPALAEGVVTEILVLEGQSVEAGQVVARMIDEDARLEFSAAQAMVAQRQADVDQAKAAVAVAASKVPIETAAADELRDEINRKRDLVKTGGVGAGEFRQLEIRLTGALARAQAAEREIEQAQATLGQMQAGLAAARVGSDQAQLRLSRMEVRSPAAGIVLSRMVQPGTRMSMNETSGEPSLTAGAVLRLYDPTKLQVRVDVPLADAAKVGMGTRATVTTEALPDMVFTGSIVRAVHEANIQRNTVQFKIALEQPSPILKPEMLTRVKLYANAGGASAAAGGPAAAGETQGSVELLVSAQAVVGATPTGGSVWVVDQTRGSTTVHKREVRTQPSQDEGFLVVVDGLKLSDRVVIDPPATLTEGAHVAIIGEAPAPAVTP